MSTTSQQWAYAPTPNTEHWHGPCTSKEDAITEALGNYGDPADGYTPCIAPCRPIRPSDEDVDESWTFVVDGPIETVPLPSPVQE